MDKLFFGLKSFYNRSSASIEGFVPRLHYKLTACLLVAFSILTTATQYFGNPISCISNDDVPVAVLNTYCWIQATFSIDTAWNKRIGLEVPYPGISSDSPSEKRAYQAYYQWVCFVLFLQAILFYVPHYFWKSFERNRVKQMVSGLDCVILAEEERNKKQKLLVRYVASRIGRRRIYFVIYILCEIANLINVVGQMFFLDRFFDGHFTSYGVDVVRYVDGDRNNRTDPMTRMFPRMTRCSFHRFGSGGGVQTYETLCLLPLNVINEKIFIFLWFWFVILACLTAVSVLSWCVLCIVPGGRSIMLRLRGDLPDSSDVDAFVRSCSLGDWFLFYLLSLNMDAVNFQEFMEEISRDASVLRERKEGRKICFCLV